MSDMEDGYGDDDIGDLLGDSFDYYYVEDTYDQADDLAEHSVPSPPPFEGDDYWDDHSRFQYWNDLEYDSDAGWQDVETRKKRRRGNNEDALTVTGQKRKAGKAPMQASKKRKTAGGARPSTMERPLSPTPTVLWRTTQDRNRLSPPEKRFLNKDEKPWALLKDWRERFANNPGFPAARDHGADTELEDAIAEAESRLDDEDNDNASSSEMDQATNTASPTPQQDPGKLQESSAPDMAALRFALQQGMAKIGVGVSGMDESKLLEIAARMLSDQNAGDDILDELAEEILGGDEEEEEPLGGFSQWVHQRAEASASAKDNKVSSPDAREGNAVNNKNMSIHQLSPSPPLPTTTANQPPTPASTGTISSQNSAKLPIGKSTHSSHHAASSNPSLNEEDSSNTPTSQAVFNAQPPNRRPASHQISNKQKGAITNDSNASPAPQLPEQAPPVKNVRKRRAEDANVENVQSEGDVRGAKRVASYARPTKASAAKKSRTASSATGSQGSGKK